MTDNADDKGMRVAVMDNTALTLLLTVMRDAGSAYGRAKAYQECVEAAASRATEIEESMQRNGDTPLLLGGVLELRWFANQFDGAPDHYREDVERQARKLAKISEVIFEKTGLDMSVLLARAALGGE